jgi:hypothetical protein
MTNKSDSIKALSAALSTAQAEMKNPHFDSVNPHFKSKFASLAAVRAAVIPTLTKYGIALSQWPISGPSSAGCLTRLSHGSGEWMEEPFLIPVDKLNAHGFASAVTYAKRIAMQSVAGVVGDEDDDANGAVGENVNGKKPEAKPANPLTEMKQDAFEQLPEDEKEFLRKLAADVTALTQEGREAEGYAMIEHKHLDTEEKLALWWLLDSKTRSAVKRAGEQVRLVAKAEKSNHARAN